MPDNVVSNPVIPAAAPGAPPGAQRADVPPRAPGTSDLLTLPPLGEQITAEADEDRVQLNIPLGKYTLLREINHGGMGAVYEAQQVEPKRTVAIKLMRTALASKSGRRRFMREVEMLAGLSHPHIAHLLDAGVWKQGNIAEVPFYAMEIIAGATPITEYARASRLTIEQRLRLFLSVCDAVQHAHEHGVLHCDLKPANILVSDAGHVKVVDFGVARLIDAERGEKTLYSDASLLMGTPQYMSPEQVGDDSEGLDARSDVYGLGIVLYELLCGHLPYEVRRSSIFDAARDVRGIEPSRPRKVNPQLSADVETVLLESLKKDPKRRYQSVAALRRDLVHLLNGEPIDARRDSIAYVARTRVSRWIARHRLFAAVVAFPLLLIAMEKGDTWLANRGSWRVFDLYAMTHVRHLPDQPFRNVVLVAMRDETDLNALARERGLKDFDANRDVRALRPLHGQLMQRLAEVDARPRVLVWDIEFAGQSPGDAEFAAGAARLRAGGTPVVSALKAWPASPGAPTALSPQIAASLFGSGAATAICDSPDEPWSIHLAHRAGNQQASLSAVLLAAAQFWEPNSTPTVEFGLDSIALQFPSSPGRAASARVIDLTNVEISSFDEPARAIHPGDTLAHFFIEVPGDASLASSTLDYDQIFHADPERLRSLLAGKAVVVGDFRDGRDGPRWTPDGRGLAGTVVMATGIEAVVNGTPIVWPRLTALAGVTINSQFLVDAGALAIAFAIGAALYRRHRARLSVELVLATLCIPLALVVYRISGHLFMPLVALSAMFVGGEYLAAIRRAKATALD